MPNVRYTPDTVRLLKLLYPVFSNAQLAEILGIDHPRKVQELARRHVVKWWVENGAPKWRGFLQRI